MIAISDALLDPMSELVRHLPSAALRHIADLLAEAETPPAARHRLWENPGNLTSANRDILEAILRVWERDTPRLAGASIAHSLVAMAWQDEATRTRQRVELVWSGPPIAGHGFRSTEQRVVEMIDAAMRSVWIVAFAAYRVPSIVAALERALDRGVRLAFVVEDADESLGRVTFDPILAFGLRMAKSATIYTWPLDRRPRDARGRYGTLHAKCVLVDSTSIFVSSANFTEFAMSLNVELGALVTSADIAGSAERLLEKLVSDGVLRVS